MIRICAMKNNVIEDIESTIDDRTISICLDCRMCRPSDDVSFEFTPSIDGVGQVVLVPHDDRASFCCVSINTTGQIIDEVTDDSKFFTCNLFAHMISDDGNFDWFENIDDVGQIVITPDSEKASFISIATDNENLNLVTDDNLNEALTSEQIEKLKEDSFKQIELLTEILQKADQPLERLTDNVNRLNPVGLDFDTLVVSPIKKFGEGITSTIEVLTSIGENGEVGEKKVTESYHLNEGTWSMPKTLKDVKTLKSVLKSPITVDRVEEIKDILYPILGDDGVFDDLDDLEPEEDARPLIKKYIKSLVNDLPDKFSSEVLDGLKSIVSGMTESISIIEEVQDGVPPYFIATIHIDDEDGSWCKVTAPSAELAVDYLLDVMKDKHPDAKFIRVAIDNVVKTFKDTDSFGEAVAPNDYSPKITGTAYKVFRVKNGKLYPPMVANPGGADTPIGVWLTADEGEFAGLSKTGRPQVKAIGSGTLAYRPGWHLGDIPLAKQFYRTNKETGEKEFPADFVWAECEYVADIDYQKDADEQGYMRTKGDGTQYRSNKYQHSLAGLPRMPKDGSYRYRTNPNPDTVPWIITGAMKVKRLLDDAEVAKILQSHGIEAPNRQGGNKTLKELGL